MTFWSNQDYSGICVELYVIFHGARTIIEGNEIRHPEELIYHLALVSEPLVGLNIKLEARNRALESKGGGSECWENNHDDY